MRFQYDPSESATFGSYETPCCKARFYGGDAVHTSDCSGNSTDYANYTYYFGPKEVEAAKAAAQSSGDERSRASGSNLTVALLREQFPHLL